MEGESGVQPLVTVAVFCYNNGERIYTTLDSIAAQTYRGIEILITDDGSIDDSVEKLRAWIRDNKRFPCRLIVNEKNRGICPSVNSALSQAKGKYLCLFGDDIMLPDKIADDVAFLEANPQFAFCHSKIISVDMKTGEEKEMHTTGSDNTFHDFFAWKTQIQAPTVTYRRSVFDDVGMYDESLIYEDFDMLLRITYKYPVGFRDAFTVKYLTNVRSIRVERQKEVVACAFAITKKWSFLPNYKYYKGRQHLMYFYHYARKYKKGAVPHIKGAIRFLGDKRLYLAFYKLLFLK
jgi:glycosyltransferase involved in cell wall biosynthesis